ncbi:MAG: FeoA domain-containing protein [Myxococcota bacterium]
MLSLAEIARHRTVTIVRVDGPRRFRRRLLEMGLTPGSAVRVLNVPTVSVPLQLEVRHCRLSIRRREAEQIAVREEAKQP